MTESADDKYINRIRALLEKAESTDSEPERNALREKAQQLMIKWQVEEWQLDLARAARGETLVNKISTKDFTSESEFREKLLLMLDSLARIIGCKCVLYESYGSKKEVTRLRVVGYEIDLRFLEMLWASLMMDLSSNLEIKPDHTLPFEENIYRLHEAGLNWERVRILMNEAEEAGARWKRIPGAYAYTDEATGKFVPGASDGGIMRKAYKRYCEENGEEYHSFASGKTYRASYVEGFTREIVTRFASTRAAAQREEGALVLYDREAAVKREFDSMFSNLKSFRPRAEKRLSAEAVKRGRQAAQRVDLSDPSSRMGGANRKSLN